MAYYKWPVILYTAGLVLIAALWFISSQFGIPIRVLIADPAQITDTPFYTGFLSNLTVITWAVGAYIALFTVWLLRRLNADAEWIRFFRMAGILTVVLMLDDLFMFHEEIFPNYLFMPRVTGIEPNEKFIIGIYGIFTLWFLFSSRHTIRKTDWKLLVVACAILGFGILADRGIAKKVFTTSAVRAFIEDSLKFLGVLGWSIYFYMSAKSAIAAHLPRQEAEPATLTGPANDSAELPGSAPANPR